MVIKDSLLHKSPLCHELLETQVYVTYVVCCHSNDHTAARAYPLL